MLVAWDPPVGPEALNALLAHGRTGPGRELQRDCWPRGCLRAQALLWDHAGWGGFPEPGATDTVRSTQARSIILPGRTQSYARFCRPQLGWRAPAFSKEGLQPLHPRQGDESCRGLAPAERMHPGLPGATLSPWPAAPGTAAVQPFPPAQSRRHPWRRRKQHGLPSGLVQSAEAEQPLPREPPAPDAGSPKQWPPARLRQAPLGEPQVPARRAMCGTVGPSDDVVATNTARPPRGLRALGSLPGTLRSSVQPSEGSAAWRGTGRSGRAPLPKHPITLRWRGRWDNRMAAPARPRVRGAVGGTRLGRCAAPLRTDPAAAGLLRCPVEQQVPGTGGLSPQPYRAHCRACSPPTWVRT